LTGAITPIKSPPKNFKSLFDFSIAGPLFGLITSLGLLYLGLEMTAFMDVVSREQLPSVPAIFLRSSTLGAGIIEYLLGDGLLNTPDPAISVIKLHPFAIAGFCGLLTNALSLLPIGNTDGGRISLAFFGRSFSRVVHGSAVLILALSGLFGADQSNILISYALYSQLWQKEPEIPCRNEVDELDAMRGCVAIAMSVFVMLTLIPLT
jgi:membrane-associated protease RseP (regulator of RpoE activity)